MILMPKRIKGEQFLKVVYQCQNVYQRLWITRGLRSINSRENKKSKQWGKKHWRRNKPLIWYF